MKKKPGKKFWLALVIFSLMGQVAWVVENMYFNVFIYKIFRASAADISMMVGMSAVAATVTTLLTGALSDKVGKRKVFICAGYIAWGISILSFCLLRMDILQGITGSAVSAASLGITLVIIMDCVMTFFGSSANDACFNAWLTESGDETNRGAIEGINAMMPLVAILVVFGGFMPFDLEKSASWTWIFLIIGCAVLAIGVLGFFLIRDTAIPRQENRSYFKNIIYGFRPSVIRENTLLYAVIGAFAVFGISIQIFMPYLILYYEKSLGMDNYVLIMAPAIILAAAITAGYGKLYDKLGFRRSVYPTVFFLIGGYIFLYFFRSVGPVFTGSLLMMTGYLSGMAIFGAKIRDNTPEQKVGLFQGMRIFGQVFIPGIVGPAIGAWVLSDAEMIVNSDGTESFLPNRNIFMAALAAAVLLLFILAGIFYMVRTGHRKLPTDLGDDRETAGEEGECGGEDVPFRRYPRPQLRRESWYCLNGRWDNGVTVPFAPQSMLSGYAGRIGRHMVYCRRFTLPEGFMKDKLLLHFGAVDQKAEVFVNGRRAGAHEGGYLPFTLDITKHCGRGENELAVRVTDTLSRLYPYGKQRKRRGDMWYTPVSGIWQTVWLESVPEKYIESIRITPDLKGIWLEVQTGAEAYEVAVQVQDRELKKVFTAKKVRIDLEEEGFTPRLWSPEDPYLYEMTITAGEDKVQSYFALRTVDIRKAGGRQRICLNGKPVFLHGILDQGYFSDGIYLPASEKGYEFDISEMKKLGFNTLRKHIKTEPECFYHMCDKMGMLVLQDMVNSGRYSFVRDTALPTIGINCVKDSRRLVSRKRKEIFESHMKETMAHLYNHPCIIYYTIFNEGWGQFDSDRMYEAAREADGTRIIDTASGWFAGVKSDVDSRHIYFRSELLKGEEKPLVLSEFGGYSRALAEHSYSLYHQHGYGSFQDREALTDKIISDYREMVTASMPYGLCGSVYTQLSDVEDEVNGLYTYDRKVCKVNREKILQLSREIYETYRQYEKG